MTNNRNSRKRRKKKANIFLLVVILIFFVVAIIIGSILAKLSSTDLSANGEERMIVVDIPEGSTVGDIAEVLDKNNVIDTERHFMFLCKLNKQGSQFKYGKYEFSNKSDFFEIVEKLNNGESIDTSTHLTVKEGMWLSEIGDEVERLGLCSKEEFMEAANSRDYDYEFISKIPERENLLEGYLYPETYYFHEGVTAREIVETMLHQFNKVCVKNGIFNKAEKAGKSLDEYIIIASLIESEVRVESERKLVSSVIQNRIEEDMKLQIDASVIYAKGKRVNRVYYSDLENQSDYNTYYVKGLPVGPICSPRGSSILAAIEPEKTDYIYYVVDDQSAGTHYFTNDYDDFLAASARYKANLN